MSVPAGGQQTLNVTYRPTNGGTDTGCLSIAHNDAASPSVSLSLSGTGLAPTIGVSPGALDFGTVDVGSAPQRTVAISNAGTAALSVTVARCGGTSTEFGFTPGAFTIPSGGAAQTLTVTYAATNSGLDAGCLALSSNDPANPSVNVGLQGTGNVPPPPSSQINLVPTSLSFNTVNVGVPTTLVVQVQNVGSATLTVAGIALCSGTSAEFGWTPLASSSIAPGGAAQLSVTYTPAGAGSDAGCLDVSSNDPRTPVARLGVTGTGFVPPAPQPIIAVSPTALAFGNVSTGGSSTRTAAVSNTGNATLNVSISRCAGTSAEFGISPDTFAVAPGATAQTLNVTYTPVDAGQDVGCFAIGSNDAATPVVNLAVSGSGVVPPPSVPGIQITPLTLDFGSLTVPGSASLNARIQNVGTATLTVTSVARCAGTSSEFSWTPPAPLSIAPGGSQTVSVTYSPIDAGTDSGCLEAASNDPAHAVVQVGVTGTGVVPPPPGALDVDIKDFSATPRLDVCSRRGDEPVDFKLRVLNGGTTGGIAQATVVGVQNDHEVYRATIDIGVTSGARLPTFGFPALVPEDAGVIYWTVTLDDEDPDTDVATAVTKVVCR